MGCVPGLLQDTSENRGTYFSFCTLCSCKHKPWVWHVITQVHMRPPAQNPTSFLLWDICFYGNSIGTNDGSAGTTLTLDFSTLGISGRVRIDKFRRRAVWSSDPHVSRAQCRGGSGCGLVPQLTFDEGALRVFATVAIRISCRVDSLKADARSRFSTWNRSTMAPPLSLLLTFSKQQEAGAGSGEGIVHVWWHTVLSWLRSGLVQTWKDLQLAFVPGPAQSSKQAHLFFCVVSLDVNQGLCGLSRD